MAVKEAITLISVMMLLLQGQFSVGSELNESNRKGSGSRKCKWEGKSFNVGSIIAITTAIDGCTKAVLRCMKNGRKTRIIQEATNTCKCPDAATSTQLDVLKMLLEQHINKSDVSCPRATTTSSITTTTTTKPTTNTPSSMVQGVLITGGVLARRNTELFLPSTGKTCSLTSLSHNKKQHSLDTLPNNLPVMCGGYYHTDSYTDCLQFSQTSASGEWTHYATTIESRSGATTWLSADAGLVLMGGHNSGETSEILNGGMSFKLLKKSVNSCSITYKDSVIITGGETSQKAVDRYNLKGHLETLPDLTVGRWNHGCGSFKRSEDIVFVVAGGYTDSTETFTFGSSAWTTQEALPRVLYGVAWVSMSNSILIIGGHSSHTFQAEILSFNGTWTQVGLLPRARWDAAATKVMIETDGQLDITGCL